MARVMDVDYGTKRVGLAVTDALQMIASPLDTIHSKDVIDYIAQYHQKNELETLVVGLPKQMDGSLNEVEVHIKDFIKKVKQKLPHLHIERVDERFTSKLAMASMISAGATKKQRAEKGNIDKVSAAIILQSYLESKAY
jgi:putative Holliday junction resolvase